MLRLSCTYCDRTRMLTHVPAVDWLPLVMLTESPIDQHERRQLLASSYKSAATQGESPWRPFRRGLGGRGHTKACECDTCTAKRFEYTLDVDRSLPNQVMRKRVAVLSIALWTNPATASEVLKRFHRAYVHYAQLAEVGSAYSEQCRALARTYNQASAILWRRMRLNATKPTPSRPVNQALSSLGGRSGFDLQRDLWTCPQCEDVQHAH